MMPSFTTGIIPLALSTRKWNDKKKKTKKITTMTTTKPLLQFLTCIWFLPLFLVLPVLVISIIVATRNGEGTRGDTTFVATRGEIGTPRQPTKRIVPPPTQLSGSPMVDGPFKSSEEQDGVVHRLPKWIQQYVTWHKQMRSLYPGKMLFTHPDAPPILIRTCLGLCGGLNDRIGQLPWDLYLANQTQRVLLLHWHRPVPLEYFLRPNPRYGLDWTVPPDVEGFFASDTGSSNTKGKEIRVSRRGMRHVRMIPELFQDYDCERPEEEFWNNHLDQALLRATVGLFRREKILRHRLLGHINEVELESRLRALGETDLIHQTPSFGKIFHLFFTPSHAVQEDIDNAYQLLGVTPGEYSAVHCRVRHPKATPKEITVKGKNEDYPADKTGLPWEGYTRQFAIEVATRALSCAKTILLSRPEEPVYFFADSNDLVRFIAHELTSPEYVQNHFEMFATNPVEAKALALVKSMNVIARNTTEENAHIDKQKGRDPPAYFSTFVDLYLAINARCVAFGVGYYAVLATKISGTSCKAIYQEEEWGGSGSKKFNAAICPK